MVTVEQLNSRFGDTHYTKVRLRRLGNVNLNFEKKKTVKKFVDLRKSLKQIDPSLSPPLTII